MADQVYAYLSLCYLGTGVHSLNNEVWTATKGKEVSE